MSADDVLDVLGVLDAAGVEVWLDGGWGVDALLGGQTRPHDDLDLALSLAELSLAERALAKRGFGRDEGAEPGLPARLVLRDGKGRRVDLHPLEFDGEGNGWQQVGEDAWGLYPAEELTPLGRVGTRGVRCISARLQLRHHLGYEWREQDRKDVGHLAAVFGVSVPPR
jgi:lincosamide nucleotidyltransferase A/C/D/E